MIGVKLWGGLGNQMFQYAFGLYLAEKRDEEPCFFADTNKSNRLDIHDFKVVIEPFSQGALKRNGYYFGNHFLYRIRRKMIQLAPFLDKKVLVENVSGYKPAISPTYSVFDGYWQSYKYLQPIEQKLREQFVLNNEGILDLELVTQIRNTNSVSLHIRRGDYLKGKNKAVFENVTMDYYEAAIAYFSKELDAPQFYVFSNDLDWVKKNLSMPQSSSFVYVDNTKSENATLADLNLMSICKHHIIANSTFSWWGAWLNSSREKKVVAPKKWYRGKMNDLTLDLIPPQWFRL